MFLPRVVPYNKQKPTRREGRLQIEEESVFRHLSGNAHQAFRNRTVLGGEYLGSHIEVNIETVQKVF